MHISKSLSFYKREDVKEALVEFATNKEVAVNYDNKRFGKRPDSLQYPNDVLEHAKKGVTSFHCSEEIWNNPLQLGREMKKEDVLELRKGWDLVLDIDCHFFEYSKIAAYYSIEALKHHGIKAITCKYSGNKGFHIAVPFEAFPDSVNNVPIKEMFPEAPRRIAAYIKFLIKGPVSKAILKFEKGDFNNVIKKTGKEGPEITRFEQTSIGENIPMLNAEPFLDIDTILISSRHLYRMPYSFHEKSELVSIPIDINGVLKFKKEEAKPENIQIKEKFLDRNVEFGEATKLLVQAFDFEVEEIKIEAPKEERSFEELTEAIPEQFFPPCVKKVFEGLEDGRKRAIFMLSNFLLSAGWNHEQVEDRLKKWNKKNPEALREVYIKGQLRYRKLQKEKVLPPNCNNHSYYKDLNICFPDPLCRKIRNPIQYSKIKAQNMNKPKRRTRTKK